ncbi:Uncharacterised protein [Salmonella enterica subsp. enterica serovar Bovismorbificans]|nr:Uncharacterised protein [Salmonella enterica subsp. enterica serovar Bovismorbificans]
MLQAGQFLQTQIQNRLRLLLSQVILTVTHAKFWLQPFRTRSVITSALQHRSNVAQIPRTRNQRRFCFCRRWRAANQFDNRVDVSQRNRQSFKDMRAVTGFTQFKNSTTRHHFTAVAHER